MKIILKIGMDVHSTTHALCAIMPRVGEEAKIIAQLQIGADYKNIVRFIETANCQIKCATSFRNA